MCVKQYCAHYFKLQLHALKGYSQRHLWRFHSIFPFVYKCETAV